MEPPQKRLIVDMDGVLADVYSQFLNYEEQEFGFRQSVENLNGKTEAAVFKNAHQYLYSNGFFRTMPLMKDSVDAVKELNKKYELFIVSAAMEFPQSLTEKHAWLTEHFPFISWKQIIFCGSKKMVQGDVIPNAIIR